jgi:hypothetical protein
MRDRMQTQKLYNVMRMKEATIRDEITKITAKDSEAKKLEKREKKIL